MSICHFVITVFSLLFRREDCCHKVMKMVQISSHNNVGNPVKAYDAFTWVRLTKSFEVCCCYNTNKFLFYLGAIILGLCCTLYISWLLFSITHFVVMKKHHLEFF